MKNKLQLLTEKLIQYEKPITANELLAEIKPLLDDYFIGEIFFDGNGISYRLPNGQKFIIKAETVA